MSHNRQHLAKEALSAALRLRQRKGLGITAPICIYDLAEKMNVEVRFMDLSSLEGMYADAPRPTILIGSLRPAGRRVYTCAHELGHHVFEHGTSVDQLQAEDSVPSRLSPADFVAQAFAGFLLMPKLAVEHAFAERGWASREGTPERLYRIACYFGVGYGTLVNHIHWSLGQISAERSADLLRVRLKDLRNGMAGCPISYSLIAVDRFWHGRPVDTEVGDILTVPPGVTHEGECLQQKATMTGAVIYEVRAPGQGRLLSESDGWASFVRVSRREYVGRSIYRHMEEVDGADATGGR